MGVFIGQLVKGCPAAAHRGVWTPAGPKEAVTAEWGGGWGGEPLVAHPVQFLQKKLRPREGQGLLPLPPVHLISRLGIGNGRRKRAACRASLRQVALLKLGPVANPTSFPWKQPVGQLVPVSLRPGGAPTGCRSWPAHSEEGDPGASSPAEVSCVLFGVCSEGKSSEWLVPASASPGTCSEVASVTVLRLPPSGALLRGGVPL